MAFAKSLAIVLALVLALATCVAVDAGCAPQGKMYKVVVSEYDMADPVSKLQVMEAPIPVPGPGEVLVHMRMRPVDPADFFSIMGVYPGFQAKAGPDAVPGLEGMGVVAKLGGGDTKGFKVGARVVPMNWGKAQTGSGTWTEYLVAKVEDLVDVPDNVSDESASQLLVNPLTAIAMLDLLAAPAGKFVLQSAGGSALGKQFIQIAKSKGLKTISTVRRCEQAKELEGYGADHVICETDADGKETDIAARVKELTAGEGAWGAVDAVAGKMTGKLQASVRGGGQVLVYGALGGMEFTGSVIDSLFRDVTVRGYWVTPNIMGMAAAERVAKMKEAMDFMAKGTVVPHSGNKFGLQDVAAAVKEANRPGRSSDGKALLETPATCMIVADKEL